MLLGVVSFTFVVSNINSIISQNKKKVKEQAKNLIFLEKMQKKYNLSNELIRMANREVSISNRKFNMDNFQGMIKYFPPNLRNELYLSIFKRKLKHINIFTKLPDEVIITLGQALTPIIYMPSKSIHQSNQLDKRIYSRGNLAEKVYFIQKGSVIMISEDYSNLPIAVYEEGSFFGDIEVFKNSKRYFSTIALTDLQLLAIEKHKFKKIFFRQYPFLGHIFLTQFDLKWNNLQEILELISDFFEKDGNSEVTKTKSYQQKLTNSIFEKTSIIFQGFNKRKV
jgi:CRP-like cAMP-binding protein